MLHQGKMLNKALIVDIHSYYSISTSCAISFLLAWKKQLYGFLGMKTAPLTIKITWCKFLRNYQGSIFKQVTFWNTHRLNLHFCASIIMCLQRVFKNVKSDFSICIEHILAFLLKKACKRTLIDVL